MKGKTISLKQARELALEISYKTDERLQKEREDYWSGEEMIKRFCDVCKKVITHNYVTDRLRVKYCADAGDRDVPEVVAEVTITMDHVTNQGDICLNCVRMVVELGVEVGQSELSDDMPYPPGHELDGVSRPLIKEG